MRLLLRTAGWLLLAFIVAAVICPTVGQRAASVITFGATVASQMPAPVAAIAGALIALFGVRITNNRTDLRTDKTLENDRVQKKLDRELNLRRDVYLAAAEAVAVGMSMLPRLADPLLTEKEVTQDFFEKSPALAKAQVICGIDVCDAILKIIRAQSEVIHDVVFERTMLLETQTTLDDLERARDDHNERRAQILQSIQDSFGSGALKLGDEDPRHLMIKVLNDELESTKAKIQSARQQVALMRVRTLHSALLGLKTIDALLPAALLAIRDELMLTIDAQKFRQLMEEHTKLVSERLINKIREAEAILTPSE